MKCGAYPDTAGDRVTCRKFVGTPELTRFEQPTLRIHSQPRFPSCVGEAVAACVEGLSSNSPVSGVSIWRDARRRQGRIENIDVGTRTEYAAKSLMARGWDPYVPGEERDVLEASEQDDLGDELFAHDKRLPAGSKRRRITGLLPGRVKDVARAIESGLGVVMCSFLRSEYFRCRQARITPGELDMMMGGDRNAHAQRVVAFSRENGQTWFRIQNSWGENFGDGGFVWVPSAALAESITFDIHVLKVGNPS